jgi:hypothetical protein
MDEIQRGEATPTGQLNDPFPPVDLPPGVAEQDRETYEALMRAIRDVGLENRVRVEAPPKDSSVTVEINRRAPAAPSPAQPRRAGGAR